MKFISFPFLLILLGIIIVNWVLQSRNVKLQNSFLLLASYFIYYLFDWKYLFLLIGISAITYVISVKIKQSNEPLKRKFLLLTGIIICTSSLFYFKYLNFFIVSVTDFIELVGFNYDLNILKIAIPLGLSYYVFKAISYLIESYKSKNLIDSNPLEYFLYLAFFPQLISGPIDTPFNLLTQINSRKPFDINDIYLGLKQVLWGLFKKVVVADNLSPIINHIQNNYSDVSGLELGIGAILFSFQIYCDFSGIIDMANGVSRILGFKAVENFAVPYFSRDIGEFWRRWHISLMNWFRTYIFYPLGGGLGNRFKSVRNVLIIFLVSGFWHGPNWTFIVWGVLHGVLFLPIALGIQKSHIKKIAYKRSFPKLIEAFNILITFSLVTILWIIFSADNLQNAILYIWKMFTTNWIVLPGQSLELVSAVFWIGVMLVIEWSGRERETPLKFNWRFRSLRWVAYSCILLSILMCGNFNNTPFLYAQF